MERRFGKIDRRKIAIALFKQPSTYAGLGLVWTAVGWNLELLPWVIQIGIACAGIAAIFLQETKK